MLPAINREADKGIERISKLNELDEAGIKDYFSASVIHKLTKSK